MKFSVRSCHASSSTPVNTLSGMERPMTMVGRNVLAMPRRIVGRMVSMKTKTTETAKKKPKIPSRLRLSIWD